MTSTIPVTQAPPNTIPGANALGFGFNILGRYSLSSVTSGIYRHLNLDAGSFTYQPTGITYAVPDNMRVFDDTRADGHTEVYTTRQKFQEDMVAKASAEASYGAFSGEFNAAYKSSVTSEATHYFGIHDANFTGWHMVLDSRDAKYLDPGFDKAARSLPLPFTTRNQQRYFDFLDTFGTHYVAQAIVGGSLRYYVSVDKSFTADLAEVKTKISLEYNAVFTKAKAESSLDWTRLGRQWAENRSITVSAVGGDTSPLNALDPGFGDSYHAEFKAWRTAVMKNPSVVRFVLQPLHSVYVDTPELQQALRAAIVKYTNGVLYAVSSTSYNFSREAYECRSNILANGRMVAPNPPTPPPPTPPAPGWPSGGLHVALLDHTTDDVLLSKVYYLKTVTLPRAEEIYRELHDDVATVTNEGYRMIMTVFGTPVQVFPTPEIANWMESCGATLQPWRRYIDNSAGAYIGSYVCIGRNGRPPGSAQEQFARLVRGHGDPRIPLSVNLFELMYAHARLAATETETGTR